MQTIFLLGRQPELGLAELESLYGAAALRPISTHAATLAAIVDVEPDGVDFRRLGGTIKYGRVLTVLDTADWDAIETYLARTAPEHAALLPAGKLSIGLSAYGFGHAGRAHSQGSSRGRRSGGSGLTTDRLLATGLTLKKLIKKSGRPVRLVPSKELELSSASIAHNGLTDQNGWELLIVRDGPRTIIGQTVAAQDIDSYTLRDRGRPKRDARVGMLPPKLAQIIINLSTATQPPSLTTILDPFCGTGVVLQEAGLMGMSVYGTDLDERMVRYSTENIAWIQRELHIGFESKLAVGDATTYRWDPLFTAVACETYLGRPFTSPPSGEVLAQTTSDCNLIIKKFLGSIGNQLAPGTRLCLAVPAWQIRPDQFRHLPLIDSLAELGYNRISFEHVPVPDLIYFREDQVVARELLVLVKQ